MHLIDRQEAQTQCGLLRSADFQQTDVGGLPQRNLHTAVALARHYRFQGLPAGCRVFRLCWVFRVCKTVRYCSWCWASQVSGSSRQDLPAVSCLIGTPPVFSFFFFFTSTVAVISCSPVFVTSQCYSLFFSFRSLSQSLHPV